MSTEHTPDPLVRWAEARGLRLSSTPGLVASAPACSMCRDTFVVGPGEPCRCVALACGKCDGRGFLACERCGNTGEVTCTCDTCEHEHEATCPDCKGEPKACPSCADRVDNLRVAAGLAEVRWA